MASLSNFSGAGGQQSYRNRDNLTLSECTCPICMYICIEPVTMPCAHTLCMVCFQQNVAEANLSCPLCRKRISTWARRATKLNKLVDEQMWKAIKIAFPQKVMNRLEGVDDDSDSESEDVFIHVPNIAAPGEIKEEYEREMQRVEAERLQVQLDEEAASRILIQQLQEEEVERLREQDALIQQDQELVRKLISHQDSTSPFSMRSTPKSTMLDRFVMRGRAHASCSKSPFISPSRCARGGTAPRVSTCTSSSASAGAPSVGPTRGSSIHSSSSALIVVDESDSSLLSTDLNFSPVVSTSRSVSANPSDSSRDSFHSLQNDGAKLEPAQPWHQQKPHRAGSADSMSQELCHFKPIHCSPRTPPRHSTGGGLFTDPPVIRSTPRNLSQLHRGSGSGGEDEDAGLGIPDGSPVMRRRLSQLAEERKEKVAALSKSTGPDLPLLPSMDGHGFFSPHPAKSPSHVKRRNNPSTAHVQALSFDTDSSRGAFGPKGDGLATRRLILPLEPNLDDSSSESDPPKAFPVSVGNCSLSSRSSKASLSSNSPEKSRDTWLRVSHKRKKDREKKLHALEKGRRSDSSSQYDGMSEERHSISSLGDFESGCDDEMPRLLRKRIEGGRSDNLGGRRSTDQNECSMDAFITTTKLTPHSLGERKEKVLQGNYLDETPQKLQAKKHNHAKSKTKMRNCDKSPSNSVFGSMRKCWRRMSATLKKVPLASSDSTCGTQKGDGMGMKWVDIKATEVEEAGVVRRPGVHHAHAKPVRPVKSKQFFQEEFDESDGGRVRQQRQAKSKKELRNTKPHRRNKQRLSTEHELEANESSGCVNVKMTENLLQRKVSGEMIPKRKCSPPKQATPIRRSKRTQRGAGVSDSNCTDDFPKNGSLERKSTRRRSSENSDGLTKESEVTDNLNSGLKRVWSTEDKENEGSQSDCSPENPSKRSRTNSNVEVEVEDCPEDEVYQSPRKSSQQPRFAIEYSPEVGGKRLKTFPKSRQSTKGKTKQTSLCFLTKASSGVEGCSSSTSGKLFFTSKPTQGRSSSSTSSRSVKAERAGTSASTSKKKSPPKWHGCRRLHSEEQDTTDEDTNDATSNAGVQEPALPGPVFLDRSKFNSDYAYKQHLEEQDWLLALQLQADFDLERKFRLSAIRRKGSDGQYLLRKKTSTRSVATSWSSQSAAKSKRGK